MKKHLVLLLICVFGLITMVACGNDNSVDEQLSSAEELNKAMIGRWIPEEGLDNDIVAFGYMSDSGFTAEADGQLCITVDYVKDDGGGNVAAEYVLEDNQLVYSTIESNYSAGGSVKERWTVTTDNLFNGKALINGVAYMKVTDDPSDSENLAKKKIESRVKPLIIGTWECADIMASVTLNKDGTMFYGDNSMGVEGTWSYDGGMSITLYFADPYSGESSMDYFHYDIDEDHLIGMSMNQGTYIRK